MALRDHLLDLAAARLNVDRMSCHLRAGWVESGACLSPSMVARPTGDGTRGDRKQ